MVLSRDATLFKDPHPQKTILRKVSDELRYIALHGIRATWLIGLRKVSRVILVRACNSAS